jgi:hypothetical protein
MAGGHKTGIITTANIRIGDKIHLYPISPPISKTPNSQSFFLIHKNLKNHHIFSY